MLVGKQEITVDKTAKSGRAVKKADNKPVRVMLGRPITIEKVAAMYRALTGKEPTAQELEEAKEILFKE